MSREERFHGSNKVPPVGGSRSPRRSSSSTKLHGPESQGSSQRRYQQQRSQRSGKSSQVMKKPPETMRRAVADCLTSAYAGLYSESGRTLRDYLAASATTDMAYIVLLEHTLAERDRSPAVVSCCVVLLKRYLVRYVPKVQTMQQIDIFCAIFIEECNSISICGTSLLPNSASRHSGTTTTFGNAIPPPLPAPIYASPSLLKSLNYVRSLVMKYIPRLSFSPLAFYGATGSPRRSLPSLSLLINKSFNSQLIPNLVKSQETSKINGYLNSSPLNVSCFEKDGVENDKYIPDDLFKWRCHSDKEQQTPSTAKDSDGVTRPLNLRARGFLDVGAAALFVGDVESKLENLLQGRSDATDLLDTEKLLQPSTLTTATSFASTSSHLKAITAYKRAKEGPHKVWLNISVSTFRPQAHTLFQYRHYSEQQPLRLNPAEVCDVVAAVCSESSPPNSNPMTTLKFSNMRGNPSADVAISVLIKLVIDMYMMDPGTAVPLTLFMLEDMLSSSTVSLRVRVFDIIMNLGVHAHLLEPMFTENPNNNEEKCSRDMDLDHEASRSADSSDQQTALSAIDNFESWLLIILYEILLILVQTNEREEIVWASALSCLLYFICDRGKIQRKRLEGLDIRVIKTFLDISGERSWSEIVHRKLICVLANMCYRVSEPTSVISGTVTPIFVVEQVDLLGGIEFICQQYARANSREEKENIFLVLLDYVLDQINDSSLMTGDSTYSFDEIQPLVTMLTFADAPEAIFIAIKHGVEGIGEILRRSVSIALSRSSNFEFLNSLLEKIILKLDSTISAFTCLDSEFLYMNQITKSYTSLKNIKNEIIETDVGMEVKLYWSTLHSLLHSKQSSYRHNGYIWLVELLLFGINEGEISICSNIKNLQQQIVYAGSQDPDFSTVPIPVSLLCGLLNSKHNFIRWGFLFVLEKLLMRCKFLLDENKLQRINSGEAIGYAKCDGRLEKASALIDLMTCGLLLLYQKNETDHINILKMCDVLFSQISSKIIPTNDMYCADIRGVNNITDYTNNSSSSDAASAHKDYRSNNALLGVNTIVTVADQSPYIYEYASTAALLLRGYAIVPMQLVARVPTSVLFWPLLQLASAATDDIALGVAVGSKGRGILPGSSSDIRAALLLLLTCKCTADPLALLDVGGKEFFMGLLDDIDSRVAYYSSAFLLKRVMIEEPEKYQRLLQNLIFKAQQSNNEKLLENPYLQMHGILQLSSDLGSQL